MNQPNQPNRTSRTSRTMQSPDRHQRIALLAVELTDPVSMLPVSLGVSLSADVLALPPRINLSGRFVWLAEGDNWPTRFTFDPGLLPYEAASFAALAKPADIATASGAERLQRVLLAPTPAYPFADGLTVVRGRLRESAAPDAAPVAGAQLWLAWQNGSAWVDAATMARSNGAGDFACLLRLPPNARPALDEQKNLELRITVMRGASSRQQAVTVPDGRVIDLPNVLAWSALPPT